MRSSLQAACSIQPQLEVDVVDGSAKEPRCPGVDEGKTSTSDCHQPLDITITQTHTTALEKLANVRLQEDADREKLRDRELHQTTHDERLNHQTEQIDTTDSHQVWWMSNQYFMTLCCEVMKLGGSLFGPPCRPL